MAAVWPDKMQNIIERMRDLSEEELEEECEKRILYCEPERVVSMAKPCNSNWYLVKWRGLPYKECTWESEDALFPEHAGIVDAFLNRSMVRRPTFKPPKQFDKICSGDSFLQNCDGKLRDYQLEGVNWLLFSWFNGTNVILADEMGLGKTIQTVVFLSALWKKYQFCGPSMIVVPLSTIDAWQREFSRWAPKLNVIVYNGDADSRRLIRHYEFFSSDGQVLFDSLLITYELALKDREDLVTIKWKQLIVDEGHRLKNNESQLFDCLNALTPINHRLLITGTPLQNSLKELWSLLHFLDFHSFPDYSSFSSQFSPPSDREETTEEAEARTSSLHALLKPHLLRRLKKDVEKSLPAKREQILRVDLSGEQKDLYKLVLAKNYIELQRHSKGKNLRNILGELKKVCNHPIIFKNSSLPSLSELIDSELLRPSSKLTLLDVLMKRLVNEGHRALIFSQSVRMLDVLECYLTLRQWPHQRIDGGVPSDARRRAIEAFNSKDSPDRAFLLSTRAGGLGINLETADTVIIYDSDWNPQNDMQAMARAHRIGQTRIVNIYRLVCSGTIEETILDRAKQKMVLDHLIIQRMHPNGSVSGSVKEASDLQAILKFGAQSLFSSNSCQSIDLDAILARAGEGQQSSNSDFLGQFHVSDISSLPSWEQIIPDGERKKAEEEAVEQELIAREFALQDAIMTSSKVRKARLQISDGDNIKSHVQEALKTGRPSDNVLKMIQQKDDTDNVANVRISLLKNRMQVMAKLDSLFKELTSTKQQLAFRLSCKVKGPNWNGNWAPKDDAMLLVGVWRHGFDFGAVRDDPELAISYSLRKGTLPQASHLLRRIDYLIDLLRNSEKGLKCSPLDSQKSVKKAKRKDRKPEGGNGDSKPVVSKDVVVSWDIAKPLLKSVKKQVAFLNSIALEDVDSHLTDICTAVHEIGHHIHTSVPLVNQELVWQAIVDIWPTQISRTELDKLYRKLCSKQCEYH